MNKKMVVLLGLGWVTLCILVSTARDLEIFSDSSRYLPPTGLDESNNPAVLTWSVYQVLKAPWAIVLFQTAVSAACWFLLAVVTKRRFGGKIGLCMSLGIILFSITLPVMSWNWLALTESLSISAMVCWLAALLYVQDECSSNRTTGANYLWILSLASCFVALSHPQALVAILIPTGIAFIVLIRDRRYRGSISSVFPVALLLGIGGWTVYRSQNLLQDSSLRIWYAVNNFAQKVEFRNWILRDSPACPQLAPDTNWADLDQLRSIENTCPEAHAYLINNGSGINWFLNSPIQSAYNFVLDFHRLSPPRLTIQDGILPEPIDRLMTEPAGLIAFVFLGIFFVLGLAAVVFAHRVITWADSLLAIALIVSFIGAMFLSWSLDGMEEARHVLPYSLLLPILLLLLPGIATTKRKEDSVCRADGQSPSGLTPAN